jgi:hypothetical protein
MKKTLMFFNHPVSGLSTEFRVLARRLSAAASGGQPQGGTALDRRERAYDKKVKLFYL